MIDLAVMSWIVDGGTTRWRYTFRHCGFREIDCLAPRNDDIKQQSRLDKIVMAFLFYGGWCWLFLFLEEFEHA